MSGDEPMAGHLSPSGEESRDALDALFPRVYEELKRVAHRQLSRERADHSLNTTGLVHEAYVRLAGLDRVPWVNRAQFFAMAAQAMRRILVDHAIRRQAQKRGGGAKRVPLEEELLVTSDQSGPLLELDAALKRLEAVQARLARVVEYRFFGGMSVEETAEVLGVSPATVKRDWTTARAWLNRELNA